MIFGASNAARWSAFVVLLLGCQHEGDAAAPTSPATSVIDGGAVEGPSEAPVLAEAGVPSETGRAAVAAAPADTPDASTLPKPPVANPLDSVVPIAYPPSALFEAFSGAKQKLIACYVAGKKKDPKLRGKVIVKFTVNANGTAKPAANEGSTLPDDDVIACVVRTVKTMHFTKPVEGTATVVYPLIFRPGDEALILPDAGSKSP